MTEKLLLTIREIQESDAEAFIALLVQVSGETQFLLLEPDELNRDPGSVRQLIRNYRSTDHSTIFVAEDEGRLLGYVSTLGEPYRRVRHRVTVPAIAVRQEEWGKGIGTALLNGLVTWARSHGVLRIEVSVITKNERAVNLFRNRGFDIEGVKLHAVRLGNRLVDEYLLVKFMDDD